MDYVIRVSDAFIEKDPDAPRFMQALQEMVDRMCVSHYKYGPMGDKYPHEAHSIDTARQRMWMYDGEGEPVFNKKGNTGNTENCLDAANQCVIERILPSHPKAHFRSQGSHESPGLVHTEDGEKFNYTPM